MVPTRSGESAIRGREGEQRRAPSESSPALRLSAVVHLSRRAVSVSVQGYAAGRRRFRALNGLEPPRSVDLRNNENGPFRVLSAKRQAPLHVGNLRHVVNVDR